MASNGSESGLAAGRRPVIGLTTYLEQTQCGVWDVPAAFLPKVYFEAVSQAGGIAVLAHPGRYPHDADSELDLVREFVGLGGQAIEVVTGSHSKQQFKHYAQICTDFDLFASAGSDFHGAGESKMDIGKAPALPDGLRPVWQLWN